MGMAEMWGVGQRWGVLEIRGTQFAVLCWDTFGCTYIYVNRCLYLFPCPYSLFLCTFACLGSGSF